MSYKQGRKCLTTVWAWRKSFSPLAHGEHVTGCKTFVCHGAPFCRWKGIISESAGDGLKVAAPHFVQNYTPVPLPIGTFTVLRNNYQANMACALSTRVLRSAVPSQFGDCRIATAAVDYKSISDPSSWPSGINHAQEGIVRKQRTYGTCGSGEAAVGLSVIWSGLKGSSSVARRRGPAQTRGVHFGSTAYNSGQPSIAVECETDVRSLKSSDGGICTLDMGLRATASAADHYETTQVISVEATAPAAAPVPGGGSSEDMNILQIDALRSRKLSKDESSLSSRFNSYTSRGIHQTAIVDPHAVIGEGVEIGPFCTVGPYVKLGNRCKLHPNAHVAGETELGENCVLLTGAIVGADIPGCTIIGDGNVFGYYSVVGVACQDMKYKKGDPCFLEIGHNNDIREYASIHRSSKPGDKTVIGHTNLIMGSCHVAHDCKIGNRNILANGTLLGGHIVMEDLVHTGGGVAVHQFCHLSSYSFLAGGAVVDRDVPMFMMVAGDRAELRGLNLEGMRRCGFSDMETRNIRKAYQKLFMGSDPNAGGIEERLYNLDQDPELSTVPIVRMMLKSVRDSLGDKRRGICRFRNWSSV